MYKKRLLFTTFCLALSISYAYAQSTDQVAFQTSDNQANTIIHCFNSAKSKNAAALCIQGHEQVEKSTLALFMEIDLSTATLAWLTDMSKKIKADLESKDIVYENINVSEKSLIVTFADVQTLQKVQKYLARQKNSLPLILFENGLDGYQLTVDTKAIAAFKEKTMQRTIDNFTYRLQQINITDATFLTNGNEQLVLLIPGVTKETQKNVIHQLGAVDTLQFRLVYDGDEMHNIIDNKKPIPENMEILITLDGHPLLVERKTLEMLGDNLLDAYILDDPNGSSQVIISFDKEGGERFYKLTSKNVGKRLAVILIDGATFKPRVLSTPVITGPIEGGQVLISGALSRDEAKNIVNSILSGIALTPVLIKSQCIIEPVRN